MYNFSIPSQLKAWIDRVVVAGKTFRYGRLCQRRRSIAAMAA
jgi:FMN-dependent NADH-azoreductase